MNESPVFEKGPDVNDEAEIKDQAAAVCPDPELIAQTSGVKKKKKKLLLLFIIISACLIVIAGVLLIVLLPRVRSVNLTMDSFKEMSESEMIRVFGKPSSEDAESLQWGGPLFWVLDDDGLIYPLGAEEKKLNLRIRFYDYGVTGIRYDKTDHHITMYTANEDYIDSFFLIDKYSTLDYVTPLDTWDFYVFNYKGITIKAFLSSESDYGYAISPAIDFYFN